MSFAPHFRRYHQNLQFFFSQQMSKKFELLVGHPSEERYSVFDDTEEILISHFRRPTVTSILTSIIFKKVLDSHP